LLVITGEVDAALMKALPRLLRDEVAPVSRASVGVDDGESLVDVLDGIVTAATEFGVFVKLEEGLEGLVHIAEMDWALVENPKSRYKVGDPVKVKVIEIKDD
jgi:transcriptional accessory protein Tex/SPT6